MGMSRSGGGGRAQLNGGGGVPRRASPIPCMELQAGTGDLTGTTRLDEAARRVEREEEQKRLWGTSAAPRFESCNVRVVVVVNCKKGSVAKAQEIMLGESTQVTRSTDEATDIRVQSADSGRAFP